MKGIEVEAKKIKLIKAEGDKNKGDKSRRKKLS